MLSVIELMEKQRNDLYPILNMIKDDHEFFLKYLEQVKKDSKEIDDGVVESLLSSFYKGDKNLGEVLSDVENISGTPLDKIKQLVERNLLETVKINEEQAELSKQLKPLRHDYRENIFVVTEIERKIKVRVELKKERFKLKAMVDELYEDINTNKGFLECLNSGFFSNLFSSKARRNKVLASSIVQEVKSLDQELEDPEKKFTELYHSLEDLDDHLRMLKESLGLYREEALVLESEIEKLDKAKKRNFKRLVDIGERENAESIVLEALNKLMIQDTWKPVYNKHGHEAAQECVIEYAVKSAALKKINEATSKDIRYIRNAIDSIDRLLSKLKNSSYGIQLDISIDYVKRNIEIFIEDLERAKDWYSFARVIKKAKLSTNSDNAITQMHMQLTCDISPSFGRLVLREQEYKSQDIFGSVEEVISDIDVSVKNKEKAGIVQDKDEKGEPLSNSYELENISESSNQSNSSFQLSDSSSSSSSSSSSDSD